MKVASECGARTKGARYADKQNQRAQPYFALCVLIEREFVFGRTGHSTNQTTTTDKTHGDQGRPG